MKEKILIAGLIIGSVLCANQEKLISSRVSFENPNKVEVSMVADGEVEKGDADVKNEKTEIMFREKARSIIDTYPDSNYPEPIRRQKSSYGSAGKFQALNNVLNNLAKNSYTYLGIPYVWGGTTRSGLDCSAFVKNVYESIGIELPRVSRDQAQTGKLVPLASARRGDLMFFYTDSSKPHTVTHVGMYLGNNKMIHASSGSGKVVIVDIRDGYFMSKMAAVKRIVDIA